jgi:Glycosyltransferase family 87
MPARPSVPAPVAALVAAAWLVLAAPAAGSAPVPDLHTAFGATTGRVVSGRVAGPETTRVGSTAQVASSETPVPVTPSETPPVGRHLSADRVLEIAGRLAKMRHVRAEYPGSYGGAYLKGPTRWQVSYFSHKGKEIGQVIIADVDGRVLEQWTGFQVAWTMARGYPGAFGRHVNALYIWLPLCVLFLVPFVDWRRPFRLLHLDLLVLLSFSVSLAFFNHADIYASVPLAYPPLVYLLVRMLVLTRLRLGGSGARAGEETDATVLGGTPRDGSAGGLGDGAPAPVARRESLHLSVPVPWLAVGVVFLLGFRVGLNVTDSNVIDVGYAGVIGAQRIVDGRALYGGYPADNEHGDTYGPVNYEVYVPFEQIFGWSGKWDDLPAAHATAVVFDLLAVGLLFLLGLRLRGPPLGVALAYAWVSYPFTLYALESNSNDMLVAVMLLAVLLVAASPPARGVFAALAGLTKLAPLALAPLFATHGLRELPVKRRARALALFVLAFVVTAAVVSIPALTHDSLHTIYERTFVYQSNRGSPFSVWGLYGGLSGPQQAVQFAAVVLALVLAVIPRRSDVAGLAAASAAILIALQLGVEHWFYLYIPWFFGLVMVALLVGRPGWPILGPAAASAPAQSSRPAAALSSG